MEMSILESIKSLLEIEDDISFDKGILIHINSILSVLQQLGLPALIVQDSSTEWTELFGTRTDLDFIKTYIYLRVKLLFDPPQNSFLVDNIKKQFEELEWRLTALTEN